MTSENWLIVVGKAVHDMCNACSMAAPGIECKPKHCPLVDALRNVPPVDAVELPCRIGDLVWGITKCSRGQTVKQSVVTQMFFVEDMRLCICVKGVCRGEWGKKVFATREEALAKMDGERRPQIEEGP